MWDRLLQITDHRPWPLPPGPYAMTMTWERLLFAHWPIPIASMRDLVPESLELDTWEGSAWIGIVPFGMRNVSPRRVPAAPWISAFLELNVRTYVTIGNRPGVFFFSLDAANPVAVEVARRWYHLPYFNARMSAAQQGDAIDYRSTRTHRNAPSGELVARYRPTGPLYHSTAGTHEAWLTERYCLYAVARDGSVYRGEIQHERWPLRRAEAEFHSNMVASGFGITLPDVSPILHYVDSLDVLAWNPVRVSQQKG